MIRRENADVLASLQGGEGGQVPLWRAVFCEYQTELVKLSDIVAEAMEKVRFGLSLSCLVSLSFPPVLVVVMFSARCNHISPFLGFDTYHSCYSCSMLLV